MVYDLLLVAALATSPVVDACTNPEVTMIVRPWGPGEEPAAAHIEGILGGPSSNDCLPWRIDNPSSGEAWFFCSCTGEDLMPYVGMYVQAWLNWALKPECYSWLIPCVNDVTVVSVESLSWGRIKSLYVGVGTPN